MYVYVRTYVLPPPDRRDRLQLAPTEPTMYLKKEYATHAPLPLPRDICRPLVELAGRPDEGM